MPATITIPPQAFAAETEIRLTLLDAAGDLYPAQDISDSGFISGAKIVTVDETGAVFDLPCNDEIPSAPGEDGEPSQWEIYVREGRRVFVRLVSISISSPPTDWSELIEAGTPVDPADIWSARLWPEDLAGNPDKWGKVNAEGTAIEFTDAPGGGGSSLHADLTDTDTDGHPGGVITVTGGTPGNAVAVAADGSLEDSGVVPGAAPITVEVTTDRAITSADANTILACNSAGAITLTEDGLLPAGFFCWVDRLGAGAVSIAPDPANQINGAGNGIPLTIDAQYQEVKITRLP